MNPKDSCGRNLPVLKEFLGRDSDTVYCEGGINISFGQLDSQVGYLTDDVALYQIIQDRPGHICWNLVPLPGCDRAIVEDSLAELMKKALPSPGKVEVRWVEKIEFTPGQKRKFVIHRFKPEPGGPVPEWPEK